MCSCLLAHPARQQVRTCACLMYSFILRIGSFNRRFLLHFWFSDAGVTLNDQRIVSLHPPCLILIPPFVCRHMCVEASSLWARFVIIVFITAVAVIYPHQRNLCLLTVTLPVTRAGGFSVSLMAYKAPPVLVRYQSNRSSSWK